MEENMKMDITDHVVLRRLDWSVHSVWAAVGQVLPHPFLHMSEQLLSTTPRRRHERMKTDEAVGLRQSSCVWSTSTHRFVESEDLRRGVEVGAELIHDHMEAADLIPHRTGHLGKSRSPFTVQKVHSRQKKMYNSNPSDVSDKLLIISLLWLETRSIHTRRYIFVLKVGGSTP